MADEEESAEKENQNPSKKRRLSLSLKRKSKPDRFVEASSEDLQSMSVYRMPENSARSSRWALNNLRSWFDEYNKRNKDDKCPEEILTPSCSKEILNKWLCVYILETRNHDGQPYPPKTVYSLLCGILREMRVSNPQYPNFLQRDDTSFNKFHVTLDNLFKSLRSDGIGSSSTHTETITKEEEDLLWTSGVLNIESPTGLLRAVFYYCGKCFCLRGGQEHRNLSLSQLERNYSPDRYVYRENASKNRQGGLKQMKIEHKVVTIVSNTSVGSRCPVFLIDLYISKLPPAAKEKDIFYCRPLTNLPKDPSGPWYIGVPIGKNTLCSMVKDIFAEAGISGNKTNHSLRVAGATSLFAAGVPERVIQGRTGHVSLEALRKYERITESQEAAVSKILTGEKDVFDDKEEKKVFKPSVTDSSSSTTGMSGSHYNNCTINVYQQPNYMHPPFHPPSMMHDYRMPDLGVLDYYNDTKED